MFGINPQRHLPNACISFAHFAGTELDEELLDKQVIGGTLNLQVDTVLAILKNHLRQPSRIEGGKTVDQIFQYPEKVFRELLVNACVHRDYSIHGSRIRVFLFDDRVEFISPGRLPNTVSIEKLRLGVSYARNPVILKFMENLRYIDKLGRGLPMVYRTATQAGKRVEFAEVGEEFRVVLGL
jgi:ATP-dependent DNA helicase RecG